MTLVAVVRKKINKFLLVYDGKENSLIFARNAALYLRCEEPRAHCGCSDFRSPLRQKDLFHKRSRQNRDALSSLVVVGSVILGALLHMSINICAERTHHFFSHFHQFVKRPSG